MARGLVRFQQCGCFHFLTFSCHHRFAHLGSVEARTLFETALERIRVRYLFVVAGYVVMPEHVHMLVSEPREGVLARAIQALKLSVAKRRTENPFWQGSWRTLCFFELDLFTPVGVPHPSLLSSEGWESTDLNPSPVFQSLRHAQPTCPLPEVRMFSLPHLQLLSQAAACEHPVRCNT
jgi:REP element-mobilizing transposase RayT